jgi:flagella basal body P-ring formation protein FlgA
VALSAGQSVATQTECVEARVDLVAGQRIFADQLRNVACEANRERRLVAYRRDSRALIARTDMAAGTFLGRLSAPRRPAISAGDAVEITVQIGSTTVSRTVTSLQDARAGRPFFVIDQDNRVFAAPASPQWENRR